MAQMALKTALITLKTALITLKTATIALKTNLIHITKVFFVKNSVFKEKGIR